MTETPEDATHYAYLLVNTHCWPEGRDGEVLLAALLDGLCSALRHIGWSDAGYVGALDRGTAAVMLGRYDADAGRNDPMTQALAQPSMSGDRIESTLKKGIDLAEKEIRRLKSTRNPQPKDDSDGT